MQAADARVNTIDCNTDRTREDNENYTGNPTAAGDEDTWNDLSTIDWGASAPFMDGGDAGNKTVLRVRLIFELCVYLLLQLWYTYGADFSHSVRCDTKCNNDIVVVHMEAGGISVSVSLLQTQAQ